MFNDSFERMLREKADEFKMYPSARVWHSIYNNMHPGRRWPSMAMSIVLIAVLLLVGYTNSERIIPKKAVTASVTEVKLSNKTEQKLLADNKIVISANEPFFTTNESQQSATAQNQQAIARDLISNNRKQYTSINPADWTTNKLTENKKTTAETIATSISSEDKNKQTTKRIISSNNHRSIENEDLIDQLITKKADGKLGLQVYASPSFIYPNLSDVSLAGDAKSSVGLEVGAAMQYAIFKKLKVTTGLQLNYLSYNSLGYFTNGTTNALIKQSQNEPLIENSSLTNTTGLYPINFRSETYQVSLPVGVEFKLIGRDRLHWDVGATIQPTYIMGGNNNRFKEESAINNWNLNAGFETFVTYKINGLTWQLGPQFRYQLMSTYDKAHTVNENLANYGVKLGVSKVLH